MPSRTDHPLPRTLYMRERRSRERQAKLESGWRDGRYKDPSSAPYEPYLAVQRWRLAHRDEARAMDRVHKGMTRHQLFKRAWPLILAHYGNRCLACGSATTCPDHVLPVMEAPLERNILANLQPLCRSCNSGKRNRSDDHRPDHGAWIKSEFGPDALVTLHSTKPRARYGSNGWAIVNPPMVDA